MATKLHYFIIYKPYKVLSQFSDEDGNPGLGSLYQLPKDVYPVGRLDLDSEGLLLLTNDKKLNHRLLNPQFAHTRTYWVEVEGLPTRESMEKLEKGVDIKVGGKIHHTAPAKVRRIDSPGLAERDPPVNRVKHPITNWLEICLGEGKNRQVRKMTACVGHPTLRLVRVAIESLGLAPLQPGEITQISQKALYGKLKLK
ncbi:MAG: pseudouridine synthase [Cyclobacteriaceae bacterium]|nr:pseudouridine synthase [Cyclobacteriaceae bacterium]